MVPRVDGALRRVVATEEIAAGAGPPRRVIEPEATLEGTVPPEPPPTTRDPPPIVLVPVAELLFKTSVPEPDFVNP